MSITSEEASDAGSMDRSRLESYIFSCELSSEVPFFTFQGDEDEYLEHFLELRTVCLGEGAKEENNVVEVTAMNHQGKKVSVPVANLHVNCLPMVNLGDFELLAPVTLHLKSGSGPVTISGLHLITCEREADSEMSEDEEEREEEEMVPVKPAKKKQIL
ncbi:nucleoplasmin-3 isoform X2 [Denticeps clupeoides]|uniref:Nucleoplasmin core domain-containing protein n=1 Tax=Denticeps clupeoides TaxID=299321 RepID=A0AAY4E1N4_9TELE|nr:nucleoplasmin-like protein NO29 isoform X2 [Denticeps clupeoides]